MPGNRPVHTIVFFAGLYILSLALPWLSLQDPLETQLVGKLIEPAWTHLWGTDELGRDVLSRVLHGFSTTVRVSLGALVSSLAIGILLGSVAGFYYDTWVDRIFNWIVNLIMALPFLLVMASILSLTRPTVEKAYVILTGIMWVSSARLVRAEVLKAKALDYVMAARAIGSPEWRIVVKTILPGCTGSAVTFSVGYLPEIVALEAGLSFLGLGVQPPEPGLGKMIFDGLSFIYSAWWISFFPAATLFVLVLAINLFMWFRRDSRV